MSELFLLRHGSTTMPGRFCGSTDVALSEDGWRQMWQAVENLSWHRIVSSPARRCGEFGRALAQHLAIPQVEDTRLREMHFGDWEGRSAAELLLSAPQEIRSFWQDPAGKPPPRAEALEAVRERVLTAWDELLVGEPAQRYLIITHGGPIRILRSRFDPDAGTDLLGIDVPHASLWDTRCWAACCRS